MPRAVPDARAVAAPALLAPGWSQGMGTVSPAAWGSHSFKGVPHAHSMGIQLKSGSQSTAQLITDMLLWWAMSPGKSRQNPEGESKR